MLDIKLIRADPEGVKAGMRAVGADPAMIDRILELDARWRAAVHEAEAQRAEKKRAGKERYATAATEPR